MTYKKISILAFTLLLISFVGTILVQNEQTEDGRESEKITISHSGESIVQSGIESDTIERLKTHSESGTDWGMNPFGSGKPIEKESPQKLVFRMPNTEWKTRTLSGITYEFGKGNPKEVVPKLKDYNIPEQDYFHDEIVRPRTELLLAQFLSNPMLVTTINKCGALIQPNPHSQSQVERNFPNSLFTADFSIQNILYIDPVSGRKYLEWERLDALGSAIFQVRNFTPTGDRENFLANQCLSSNEISEFDLLMDQYLSIGNSAANDSPENRKEVIDFLQ